jgi:hypothetical protein
MMKFPRRLVVMYSRMPWSGFGPSPASGFATRSVSSASCSKPSDPSGVVGWAMAAVSQSTPFVVWRTYARERKDACSATNCVPGWPPSTVLLCPVGSYECSVNWKVVLGGLGIGVAGVVVVVVLLVVAAIGGVWWFVTDDAPLMYYDARPAVVGENALAETGYRAVNDTAFNASYSPIPFVGRDVRVRTWATVYVSGVSLPNGSVAPAGPSGNASALSANTTTATNASADVSNVSLVTVFSMSALKLGPVAFNPVVYATDPGLLDASGVLIDRAETYLPQNVTDVSNVDVRSTREVTMLGTETEMTTLTGELNFDDGTESADDPTGGGAGSLAVEFYVSRVVHRGEVVVVFGVVPPDSDSEPAFATLVEGVRMGDWDAEPGWTPPTPSPGNATEPVGRVRTPG